MVRFLVEVRLHGYAKSHAKELIFDVAKRFGVRGAANNKVVPHISLYGPGETDNLQKVVSAIERIGRKHTLIPYTINRFGFFNNLRRVIFLEITPSKQLQELRWELAQELQKVATCQHHDRAQTFTFHATVAFQDIDRQFDQIWAYIQRRERPDINQHLLRITLLGPDSRIVCEYDCVLQRLLNRRQALDRNIWRQTVNRLRDLRYQNFKQKPIKASWYQKLSNWFQKTFHL